MTIEKETGTGSPTANTYVTVAEANDYFSRHSAAAKWAGMTQEAKETALLSAARTLDYGVIWKGVKASAAQAMQWPRKGVIISTGAVEEDTVPSEVVLAQLEITGLVAVSGDRTADPQSAGIKSASLGKGALEVEFDASTARSVLGTAAPMILREYTLAAGGTRFVRTVRV